MTESYYIAGKEPYKENHLFEKLKRVLLSLKVCCYHSILHLTCTQYSMLYLFPPKEQLDGYERCMQVGTT